MSDPKRIRQERAGSLESRLVDAMRSERPSAKSRQRGLAALAGAGASTAIGWTARAAAMRLLTHWTVVGGGSGLLAVGVAHEIHHAISQNAQVTATAPAAARRIGPRPPSAAPVVSAAPPPSVEEKDVLPELGALPAPPAPPAPQVRKVSRAHLAPIASNAVAVAPTEERSMVAVNAAPPIAQDSLADEVASLYGIKSALDMHQAKRALLMLEAHRRKFPGGRLKVEADVLRAETLLATGEVAESKALARALLDRDPSGPHAQRIRSLLEKRSSLIDREGSGQ